MTSPLDIIDRFYPPTTNPDLRTLLLIHSWQVATLALRCAAHHPELNLDRLLILRGALLHDIGILHTDAPSIGCHGHQPYLMHGFIGARMLRQLGMETEARICERHTGAGLTLSVIKQNALDVPLHDYLPETLEEQLVCYADKFYSKSKPQRVRNPRQAYQSLLRFGQQGADRFARWHRTFAVNSAEDTF